MRAGERDHVWMRLWSEEGRRIHHHHHIRRSADIQEPVLRRRRTRQGDQDHGVRPGTRGRSRGTTRHVYCGDPWRNRSTWWVSWVMSYNLSIRVVVTSVLRQWDFSPVHVKDFCILWVENDVICIAMFATGALTVVWRQEMRLSELFCVVLCTEAVHSR